MKWTRIFLLFFLLPSLMYAYYDSDNYQQDVNKISAEWKRHDELIQQFHALSLNEKEHHFSFVNASIACCRRAIIHCKHILKKIAEKPKKTQKKWEQAKNLAKQNKIAIKAEIAYLQTLITSVHREIAFTEAISLYQESEQKANLATLKNQNCVRDLNNVEEVIAVLQEVVTLYQEALSLARDALHLISAYPDEESKHVLRTAIEIYEAAANQCEHEIVEWPLSVVTQINNLKQQVVTVS